MSAYDERTVQARKVLLDGLEALVAHRDALILVGAQAVYLRTDQRQVTFSASYTTDGDVAVDPSRLGPDPLVEDALTAAGFERQEGSRPGIWMAPVDVDGATERPTIDLLVPEAVAGRKGRTADVPPHDRMSLTQAKGLEAALVDNDELVLTALDPADTRHVPMRVAGLPALLIAKLHKLADRLAERDRRRVRAKDAADTYRIMLALDDDAPLTVQRLLGDPVCGPVAAEALGHLRDLYGGARRPGVVLAADALAGDVARAQVAAVCVQTARLLGSVER